MKPAFPFPIPKTPEIDPRRMASVGKSYLDVAYATEAPEQVLDLYLPEGAKAPYPLILYIHEGAFAFGSKRDKRMEVAFPLLEMGFALASIEYRKSEDVTWPAQVYDVKAAVRFLRGHAVEYQLDPERFGVWGVSAGGYLGNMLGVTAHIAGLEDPEMGHADVASSVQAVVDWYGCCRFDHMDDQIRQNGFGRPTHNNENSPESIMMGNSLPDIQELCRLASPVTYVHEDIPPFLIQHGRHDPVTPVQQSIDFAARIEEVAGKDRVKLVLYDAGHDANVFYTGMDAREEVYSFFQKTLK